MFTRIQTCMSTNYESKKRTYFVVPHKSKDPSFAEDISDRCCKPIGDVSPLDLIRFQTNPGFTTMSARRFRSISEPISARFFIAQLLWFLLPGTPAFGVAKPSFEEAAKFHFFANCKVIGRRRPRRRRIRAAAFLLQGLSSSHWRWWSPEEMKRKRHFTSWFSMQINYLRASWRDAFHVCFFTVQCNICMHQQYLVQHAWKRNKVVSSQVGARKIQSFYAAFCSPLAWILVKWQMPNEMELHAERKKIDQDVSSRSRERDVHHKRTDQD